MQTFFNTNIKANEMSKQDVISKWKMLSQGISESVLTKMAMTLTALVKQSDFSAAAKRKANGELKPPKEDQDPPSKQPNEEKGFNPRALRLQGSNRITRKPR